MLCRYGGYGNAEERPERHIGFAGGSVLFHCLFYCLLETKGDKPRGMGQSPITFCIPAEDKILLLHIGSIQREKAWQDSTDTFHCCNSPSNHQQEV